MIPILYEAGETSFTTNGLGGLPDAAYCVVTEERNGEYELAMEYPLSGLHYDLLKEGRIIYAPHDDTKLRQPFEIYRISSPMDGIVTVSARHISYLLSKITAMPFTASSVTQALQGLKNNAANTCPFTFWTDKGTTGNFSVEVPQSIRSMLGGQQGSILDIYGSGEYEWDHYTVKFHNNRGIDSGVTLRYGKNIEDLQKVTDAGEVWTGIVPYWQGTDDSSGQSVETVVTLSEKVVYASNPLQTANPLVIPVDFSGRFESMPTQAQLRLAAQQYVAANAKSTIPVSIEVSFVQLWQTEEYKNVAPLQRLSLCDTVTVYHEGLDVNVTAKIVKAEYDVIQERYSSMTVGDVRNTLAKTIANISNGIEAVKKAAAKEAKTAVEAAVSHATELIRGGLGGNVVMNTDANGKPTEILIMDTDDISTAVNVLRINMNGIGFSETGYNGPFTSAWTIDGNFVADFITTGTLNAALIKVGLLQDAAGINYWNMATGEFRLASTVTVGGQTVAAIAQGKVDAQTQADIFNKLTNNGTVQGITMDANGNLYINANYINSGTISANLIAGGTLKLGGSNNTNGLLQVYDASGNVIGKWGKDGISITKGSVVLQKAISSTVMQKTTISDSGVKTEIDRGDTYNAGVALEGDSLSFTDRNGNVFSLDTPSGNGLIALDAPSGCAVRIEDIYTGDISNLTNSNYVNYWNSAMGKAGRSDSTGTLIVSGPVVLANNPAIVVGCTAQGTVFASRLDNDGQSVGLNGAQGISINSGDSSRRVNIIGSLYVNSTSYKSKISDTENYGQRLLFCYEMAAPIYGDVGGGEIGEDGLCVVDIDDVFLESVESGIEYRVFLQAEGEGNLWVQEKEQTHFSVRGTPGLKFSWEIKARQKGFKTDRLESVSVNDWIEEGSEEIRMIEAAYENELESILRDQEETLYAAA